MCSIATPDEPNVSSTRWCTVVRKLDLGRGEADTFAGDASAHFAPADPFTFVGVSG